MRYILVKEIKKTEKRYDVNVMMFKSDKMKK